MEINSQKPREWVDIVNEPNYIFTTTHMHVLWFKGLAHLLSLAPILFFLTLPCLVYFTLPYPILSCHALPYLVCPALGHACPTLGCALNPKPNSNLNCKKTRGIMSMRFFIGFHSWNLRRRKRNNNMKKKNVHGDSFVFSSLCHHQYY
jgi:hypothetical protein